MHHARMVRACAHRARGGRRDEPNVDDSGSKLRNLHNSPRGESSLVSIKGSGDLRIRHTIVAYAEQSYNNNDPI
jgi:hypothetical protein